MGDARPLTDRREMHHRHMDWGTVVSTAITAAVGLAGIGGTLMSARISNRTNTENLRTSINAENDHARLIEKRRVYSGYLAALTIGYLQASVVRSHRAPRSKEYAAAVLEANRARAAAMNALSEVRLIGSLEVGSLASHAVLVLLRFLEQGGGEEFGKAHAALALAMRKDLGEYVPEHVQIDELLQGLLSPEASE